MVEKLCERYGEPIAEYGGRSFRSFPSVAALAADGVESELRQLGFGYRARYIGETARQVEQRGGHRWLHSLRQTSYPDCHAQLRQLCGVGAKVGVRARVVLIGDVRGAWKVAEQANSDNLNQLWAAQIVK